MIVAVADTNVLLSSMLGLASPDSIPGEIFRRWLEDEFLMLVSPSLLAELDDVLSRPYFLANIQVNERNWMFDRLRTRGKWIAEIHSVHGVAPDPKDDHVIATALSGNATYLVTGDRTLRAVDLYAGVRFITPREFLNILDQERETRNT